MGHWKVDELKMKDGLCHAALKNHFRNLPCSKATNDPGISSGIKLALTLLLLSFALKACGLENYWVHLLCAWHWWPLTCWPPHFSHSFERLLEYLLSSLKCRPSVSLRLSHAGLFTTMWKPLRCSLVFYQAPSRNITIKREHSFFMDKREIRTLASKWYCKHTLDLFHNLSTCEMQPKLFADWNLPSTLAINTWSL